MISTVIMAHESRRKHAEHLAAELGARVSMDDGSLGENANGDRAWGMIPPASDWGLVVQDDALPVPGMMEHLAAGLQHCPRTCVSLYVGGYRPRPAQVSKAIETADSFEASWLSHETLLWGVAVAVPTELIPFMLADIEPSRAPYDERIGAWFKRARQPVYYTWPSLVDHADWTSLVGHHTDSRVARRLGVPEWNSRAAHIA